MKRFKLTLRVIQNFAPILLGYPCFCIEEKRIMPMREYKNKVRQALRQTYGY